MNVFILNIQLINNPKGFFMLKLKNQKINIFIIIIKIQAK